MKPTVAQVVVAYAAAGLLLLGTFHQRLGLSDTWGIVFPLVAIVCMIVFFRLRRQQKSRALQAGEKPTTPPPRKWLFWLCILLLVVGSLSSPLWLPYTPGPVLSFRSMVIVGILTCILSVTAFVIGWKNSRRSNHALESTATRR